MLCIRKDRGGSIAAIAMGCLLRPCSVLDSCRCLPHFIARLEAEITRKALHSVSQHNGYRSVCGEDLPLYMRTPQPWQSY